MDSIVWLELEEGEPSNFIVAQVSNSDDIFKIRIAIDKITATGFKEVLKKKPFEEKKGNKYFYLYAGHTISLSENEFAHYVQIQLGKARIKEKIICSKFFCQNLKWIMENTSREKLSELIIP